MWQPIVAAPQLVPILGTWRNGNRWTTAQVTYQNGKWLSAETGSFVTPTLWAPLPVGA